MRRREFIMLFGGAAAAWPLAAQAQQPRRIRRIGVFMPGMADEHHDRFPEGAKCHAAAPTHVEFAPAIGFARNRETAPAYWMLDLLWLVLVDGHETGGAFSVMEQWMRQGSGPPIPHIHPIDEWFYVMEGEMTVELGDQTIIGRAGDSFWIPRGTVHRFKVTSPVCRALNGYTPAGFEQVIIGLAKPAERRELPPLMDPPDQITIDKVFNNYWCAEARDGWALSRLGIR